MEKFNAGQLLQLIEQQARAVKHFTEVFTLAGVESIRAGKYKAAVLLRDYRIVEITEQIDDFNSVVVLAKLQHFVAGLYAQALCFCLILPIRAPIINTNTFNNYLLINIETSFKCEGRVYRIRGPQFKKDIAEIGITPGDIQIRTDILQDPIVRPYLNLFHLPIHFN